MSNIFHVQQLYVTRFGVDKSKLRIPLDFTDARKFVDALVLINYKPGQEAEFAVSLGDYLFSTFVYPDTNTVGPTVTRNDRIDVFDTTDVGTRRVIKRS